MNNIIDNRSGNNYPCTLTRVLPNHIIVNMSGANGFNAVTGGANGTGIVTDATGNSYKINLPGLNSSVGTYEVTFNRII
jgi:hypothetical protein